MTLAFWLFNAPNIDEKFWGVIGLFLAPL